MTSEFDYLKISYLSFQNMLASLLDVWASENTYIQQNTFKQKLGHNSSIINTC